MNKDNIINDANKLLDKYDTNDFVKMFRLEGFTILMSSLKGACEGYLSIEKENLERIGTTNVICVNRDLTLDRKKFIIAHLYAHYYYEYLPKSDENLCFYSIYYLDECRKEYKEKRANLFAETLTNRDVKKILKK